MSILAANSNNDIYAQGGRLVILTGIQAVLQHCEQAIKAIRGEMIYAADRGLNTFDSVWSGSPNILSFESSARQALTRIEGVISVTEFTAAISGDVLNYRATIRTTFGTGTING